MPNGFLLLLLIIPVALGATPRQPIAVVTGIKGSVQLKRAGSTKLQTIQATTILGEGDTLRLSKDASATLYRENASSEPVEGERTIVIVAKKVSAVERPRYQPIKRIDGLLNATMRSAPMVVRGTQSSALTILSPRYSRSLTQRPVFLWEGKGTDREYTIVILNKVEDEIYRATVKEPSATLPPGMVLPAGNYFLEVRGRDENGVALFDTVRFSVASATEAAAIRKAIESAKVPGASDDAPPLFLISALMETEQFETARAELQSALGHFPQDRSLRLLLAEVYRRMRLEHEQEEQLRLAGIAIRR